jgi:hypothetical protein
LSSLLFKHNFSESAHHLRVQVAHTQFGPDRSVAKIRAGYLCRYLNYGLLLPFPQTDAAAIGAQYLYVAVEMLNLADNNTKHFRQ